MSDGWDDRSAYGHTHELPVPGSTEGPLRYMRLVARNSGLFYVSATYEGLRLMQRLASRMAHEDVWDQSAYNQETFRLAHGEHLTPAVTFRVMNYLCFLNTKTFFKYMRHDEQLVDRSLFVPVSAHVNYHPEKEARMVTLRKFYEKGDVQGLRYWNGGEGPNTGTCRGKVGVSSTKMARLGASEASSHKLAAAIIAADETWLWRGRGPYRFQKDGTFTSPLGNLGSWGTVPSQWRKDSLNVQFDGETYLLMFLSEKWAFVALRCSDEDVSYGVVQRDPIPKQRLMW